MKISVITVCYNSAETIRDTIESVLAQTYPNIEYIIVDGASKDQTLNIVNEYQDKIECIISEPDKGIYDAMNKGIAAATGDVIGILNSDDFFESASTIDDVVNKFLDNPESDLVFGDVVFVDPGNLEFMTRYYSSEKFRPWKLRFGWMPPHPATFIRSDAYRKIGEYSLDYKISADYEMFVRILLVSGMKYSRINSVLVRMRAGGLSTSGIKSTILLNNEIVKACNDNNIYTNILFVLSKMPFKLLELIIKPKS